MREVLEGPVLHVVDATELLIMHDGVLALEGLGGLGQPLHEAGPHPHLAGGQGLVGEPPEQCDADDESDEAVEQEHPPETLEAAGPVHHLEAGGDEADDGGGQLRGGVVHADPLASARRRVEEGQVEGHAGPHAGDDGAEEEAQEPVTWLAWGVGGDRRGRSMYLALHGSCTAAKHAPTMPVAMTILAIHARGPTLLMTRLLGKSKMMYET